MTDTPAEKLAREREVAARHPSYYGVASRQQAEAITLAEAVLGLRERLERAEAERDHWKQQAREWADASIENGEELDRLRRTVELLRVEEAERFWHLYRTHPYAKEVVPDGHGDQG